MLYVLILILHVHIPSTKRLQEIVRGNLFDFVLYMLLRQITGNIVPKLPYRLTGALTCFVQRVDFGRSEIQVRQYGRYLSATGGRVFVTVLFTPADRAGHFFL